MKSIFAASNVVVCKLITLSLLCVGVGGCVAGADSTAVEGDTDTVGVASEEMVRQTLIELHGSEPATLRVQMVTRAQQNAELAERDAADSEPAPGEGQEKLGTAQQAIGTISCSSSTFLINDGSNFTGTNTLCISGAGSIDLAWICKNTGVFAPLGSTCGPGVNNAWQFFVNSYKTRNNIGYFNTDCNFGTYVIAGSSPGCPLFPVGADRGSPVACDTSARMLTIGNSVHICGNEERGGH